MLTYTRNIFGISSMIILLFGVHLSGQELFSGSIMHDGTERTYLIYVPSSYFNATAGVPLVLNFHGYTSSAQDQTIYGDFRNIADRENFLIVHPQGTIGDDGETYWNAQWNPNGVDDISFVSDLIDSLVLEYNINTDRIYSTGMSNGGFMSYTLACELSDKIAAIASVTGTMTLDQIERTCNPENITPIMQIHGTNDNVVPYNGNNLWMAPIEDVLSFWRERNDCSLAEIIQIENNSTTDQSTVEHQVNINCLENGSIEFFKVIGGTHTWPGSVIDFGVTNYDIDASEEIWRFFSQYSLDGFISSDQDQRSSEFNIYPTIVSDILNITFSFADKKELRLIDLHGNVLFRVETSQREELLPVSHLASGVYILQVQKNEEIHSRCFVKN